MVRWRPHRDAVVCVALTLLAFLQAPGKIVPDTKIDLLVDPTQWLSRSLHLWDPSGAFGQVQNQAYGYLWPMGPFFAVGEGIGLPVWVVQRMWWALLFCVAYLGVVRLAERLVIGTPTSRVVAGVAFALSPRILTQIGEVSVETWPSAIAPWVLVPLVGLSTGGSIRRAVTLSALAVACAGGVNATAVFATVPLAFLWLWTLQPARRRLVAIAAWCAAVLAATAWWIVPLLALGRYSPPFLDYIETAATTTWVTDPVTVLRGASYWPAWLDDPYLHQMPAGYLIARSLVPAAASMALAILGLAGLARRGMPHRRVLVAGLVVGFALVSLGHTGALWGTFNGTLRAFLDGAGAPLRNVHKFDVLIRLPLVLGIAHLLGVLLRARFAGPVRLLRGRGPGFAVTAGTLVAVLAVTSPAAVVGLAAPRGFTEVPDYWRSAATWLNERSDEGRVLVIPGMRFPRYTWGDTLEEITQPLLHGPSAVRNVIPLSPPSTIRMMDEIEAALATGYGSPGLADYLARAGISYVVVRNDIEYGRAITTPPLIVQQAIDRSPGLAEVQTFGPPVVSPALDGSRDELAAAVPALRILRVDRRVDRVVAYPADQATTVIGGPESMLWLADAGLLPAGPIVLAGDLAEATALGDPAALGANPVIVTDSLRLRDRSFGGGRDPSSPTLTEEEDAGAKDLLPSWGRQWTVPAAYLGIESVRASTSQSDKNPAADSRPEHSPFAAFDGDPATYWRPTINVRETDEWVEVTLSQAQNVSQVVVRFADPALTGGKVTRTVVETDAGRGSADVVGSTAVVRLDPSVPVRRIRVGVEAFAEIVKEGTFGIAEVDLPGLPAQRTLLVPAPPAGTRAATVVLTAAAQVPACFFPTAPVDAADSAVRCADWIARGSEDGSRLDRTINLTAPGAYTASVWALARPGASLDAVLDGAVLGAAGVAASSSAFAEPAARPGVVVDGDPATTWRAAIDDPTPELRFTWPQPQVLDGLRIELATSATAALGTPVGAVTVVAGNRELNLQLVNGEVHFDDPIETGDLIVRLHPGAGVRSFDPYGNKALPDLPIAVSEVTFLGPTVPSVVAADPESAVDLPCGSGPTVVVGDRSMTTRLVATVRDLVQRRSVPAVICTAESTLQLGVGTTRVRAEPSDLAVAARVALVPAVAAAAPTMAATVHIDQWSATRRLVTVAPHDNDLVLAVRENTNVGWVATIDGVQLSPLVVDGWQQGWVVPAGRYGQVELRFAPDPSYRLGLLIGALLVLGVLVMALLPRRRPSPAGPGTSPRTGVVVAAVSGVFAFVLTAGVIGGVVAALGLVGLVWRPRLSLSARARSWVRLAQWLLPAALLVLASAAWVGAEAATYHWIPQLLGILAVAALWLQTLLTTARRAPRGR